jgi:hypothetical protein
MNLSAIIQSCAGIERQIGEVYQKFATRWPGSSVGDFWEKLAAEEMAHGMLLDEAVRLPGGEREEASIDAAKLEEIRRWVSDHFPTDRVSLDQALALAMDLEGLELDNIYRRLFAITANDHRMSNAFRTILGQIGRHDVDIARMIASHSGNVRLLERAAQCERQELRSGTRRAASA